MDFSYLLSPHVHKWGGQNITKNGIMHYNSVIQQTTHRVKFVLFLLWGAGFRGFFASKNGNESQVSASQMWGLFAHRKLNPSDFTFGFGELWLPCFAFFLALYRPNKSIQSNCFCSDCIWTLCVHVCLPLSRFFTVWSQYWLFSLLCVCCALSADSFYAVCCRNKTCSSISVLYCRKRSATRVIHHFIYPGGKHLALFAPQWVYLAVSAAFLRTEARASSSRLNSQHLQNSLLSKRL